jgi:hypothetical protein
LSEASASYLANIPDFDKVKFLSSDSVQAPWKNLFEQLLNIPMADFSTVTDNGAAPVAA